MLYHERLMIELDSLKSIKNRIEKQISVGEFNGNLQIKLYYIQQRISKTKNESRNFFPVRAALYYPSFHPYLPDVASFIWESIRSVVFVVMLGIALYI